MRRLSLLVVLLACPAASARDPEPKYEGKPLSYWLEKFQKAETDEQRQNAAAIVAAFGADAASAVTQLVEMLHDHSPVYRAHVTRMFIAVGPAAKGAVPDLIKMLEAKPPRSPGEVCQVLCAIGPDAKSALPAIRKLVLEQVGVKRVNHEIDLYALHQTGQEAAPLLIEALESLSPRLNERNVSEAVTAINALAHLKAKAAAPGIKPLLKSEYSMVRFSAADALWLIGQNVETVPVLVGLVDNDDSMLSAISSLGRMGPAAKDALPKLRSFVFIQGATGRQAELQEAVRAAIKKIEAKPK